MKSKKINPICDISMAKLQMHQSKTVLSIRHLLGINYL